MFRVFCSIIPQLAENGPKRMGANVHYIYGFYTKSRNRNYSQHAIMSDTSGTAQEKETTCKQYTTLAKMFNCHSPKSFGAGDKVSIVGLDDTGIAIVYTLLAKGITNNICMVDMNENILQGEQMDLQSSALFLNNPRICSSKDPADTRDSKVCIVTTGTYKGRNETDQDYIIRSSGIIRAIVTPVRSTWCIMSSIMTVNRAEIVKYRGHHQLRGQGNADNGLKDGCLTQDGFRILMKIIVLLHQLAKHSPDAIFIVACDPVDILTYATWRISGFPKQRIIGIGTLMDTARFQYLLSVKLGVAPESCSAYIIGEHGHDNSVPVWSNVNVAGVRLVDLNPQIGLESDPEMWDEVFQDTVKVDQTVRQLKGTVSWSIGLAVAEICKAIFTNTYAVLPVSTYVKGEHSIRDEVFLSLPCVIGRLGVTNIIRQALTDHEATLLRRGADHIMEWQEISNKLLN